MLSRIRLMLQDKVDLLKDKTVAVFGVGGVGGYTVEALIRSGIENIDIYDFDTIDISNINRQVIANSETVGKNKVDEWVNRAKLINPNINITIERIGRTDVLISFILVVLNPTEITCPIISLYFTTSPTAK